MAAGAFMFPFKGVLGHVGIPGLAPYVAMALFNGGMGCAFGAYMLYTRGETLRRALGIGLGVLAFGAFGVATALPLIIHATPAIGRPSTRARLQILEPTRGEVIQGNPATDQVELRLEGGRIVPTSSLHLVLNAGHIHLYPDGSLVSMTGLDERISASPGPHTLRAEFVAVDNGP